MRAATCRWCRARRCAVRADWTPAAGHRVSGGVNWVSSQHPDFNNACTMPSYTTADARYAYQWQQLELSLGVANLFDRKYFTQAFGCAGGRDHRHLSRSRARRSRRRCASSSERTGTVPAFELPRGPQRIVCLTEETTEWLYLLGEEARIVGISGYTVRPRRAREEKPKVSAFLTAKIDKILELRPDCVFGFSDLQADIAAELIRQGVQVTVFNQRSVEEIFSMLYQVAAMVGQDERGHGAAGAHARAAGGDRAGGRARCRAGPGCSSRNGTSRTSAPSAGCRSWSASRAATTAFPSWRCSRWARTASSRTAREIVRRNPDIVIGSWCGKKFRPEKVAARPGLGGRERGARTASCSRSSPPTSCSPAPRR